MRESFEQDLSLVSETLSLDELATSTDFSPKQKGIIFQKILERQSRAQRESAPDSLMKDPPPETLDQQMLAPLSSSPADAVQMRKNRNSARDLESTCGSAPVLTSAMEAAARALSTTGSLPQNVTTLLPGSAPPSPPPPLPALAVEYLLAKVSDKISFAFSRVHDMHAKSFLCLLNGFEGQPICSSENGA